jgi:hypothetical protein
MKKKVARLKTDLEAEAFLDQDLSNLDFSQFKTARFEFEKKDEQLNMRIPRPFAGSGEGARKSARHSLYASDSGSAREGNGRT